MLRETRRIVGVMVGGITKFKQQDGLRGVPLELCMEEVTLAISEGWAVPCRLESEPQLSADGPDSVEAWLAEVAPRTGQRVCVPLLDETVETPNDASTWTFPSSRTERLRCAVFADLHQSGHWLTSGAKFGADFLAYPGDPFLYHAQFTVRIHEGTGALHPLTLAAAGRASHAARKHLLLCSAEDASDGGAEGSTDWRQLRVRYLCVTPETGFGRAP